MTELSLGEPYSGAAPGGGDNVMPMDLELTDRYESLPERLIREAIDAGEFDHLPGAGQPMPGAGVPDDDLWWVRGWLKRNEPEADRGGWNSE